MKRFPTGRWGRMTLCFHPAPLRAPFRPFAAMVFAWQDGSVLLCNIPGRGWGIPSGRVEACEDSVEAARRETLEEGGAIIENLRYMGCYEMISQKQIMWAEAYTASIQDLVDIPEGSESQDRKLVEAEHLPNCYYMWDPLTEAVFEYSRSVFKR